MRIKFHLVNVPSGHFAYTIPHKHSLPPIKINVLFSVLLRFINFTGQNLKSPGRRHPISNSVTISTIKSQNSDWSCKDACATSPNLFDDRCPTKTGRVMEYRSFEVKRGISLFFCFYLKFNKSSFKILCFCVKRGRKCFQWIFQIDLHK